MFLIVINIYSVYNFCLFLALNLVILYRIEISTADRIIDFLGSDVYSEV